MTNRKDYFIDDCCDEWPNCACSDIKEPICTGEDLSMKQPIRRDDLIAELQKFPNDEVLIQTSSGELFNIRGAVAEPYMNHPDREESGIILIMDD